jgi:hypothetical protein
MMWNLMYSFRCSFDLSIEGTVQWDFLLLLLHERAPFKPLTWYMRAFRIQWSDIVWSDGGMYGGIDGWVDGGIDGGIDRRITGGRFWEKNGITEVKILAEYLTVRSLGRRNSPQLTTVWERGGGSNLPGLVYDKVQTLRIVNTENQRHPVSFTVENCSSNCCIKHAVILWSFIAQIHDSLYYI